jgi:hypothetical protein
MQFLKVRKLKNFLIFPKFQLTLVFLNFWVMTICFGIYYFSFYQSFENFRNTALEANVPEDSFYFSLLKMHQNYALKGFILSLVVGYIINFILTILITHRASGPIYRLKKYFEKISEKKEVTEKLSFRKNDYYEDLPDIVNNAIDEIKNKKIN